MFESSSLHGKVFDAYFESRWLERYNVGVDIVVTK